jgi:hypothetical protein
MLWHRGRFWPKRSVQNELTKVDHRAGNGYQCFVDVGAAFVPGAQPLESVQPRERAFDDPAVDAEAGAVLGVAAGDDRGDAQGADLGAVVVVVVAAVGVDAAGSLAGPATGAADLGDRLEQGQ